MSAAQQGISHRRAMMKRWTYAGVWFAMWLGMTSAWAQRANAQTCYIHPFSRVSDPYGCCESCSPYCSGRSRAHRGTDYFHANPNQPVPAAADGVVVSTGLVGDLGNTVEIRHTDGMYTTSCHLSAIHVSPGQAISRGQIIGLQGATGYAFGEHVHVVMSTVPGAGPSGPTQDAYAYIQAHLVCRPDRDGDGSYEGDDCDDNNANRRPGLAERCDNADNDCDSRSDESVSRACGSTVGACEVGVETCNSGVWGACLGSTPAVAESCDLLDNDCDGEADEEQICAHEDAALAATLFSRVSTDIDGDGDSDACLRTPDGFTCLTSAAFGFDRELRGPRMSEGWSELGVYTSVRMGDVDGDGMDDVCAREGNRIVCWGATRVGFVESIRSMPLGRPSPGADSAEFWLADVNGDVQMDLCVRDVGGLHCDTGSGDEWTLDSLSDEAGYDEIARHASIRFGDVNGDGRDDVCARDEDGLACWLSTAAGFGRQTDGPAWSDANGWSEPRYGSTIRLIDVDGDARADACGLGPEGFVCVLASERGWGASVRGPTMSTEDGFDSRSMYATIRMGDVDGDGASDVCARVADGVHCWLWTGESFGREVRGPALSDETGWDANARYTSIRLADVSGDGRADLCARADDGLRCWLSEGTHFARQRRASAWNDALGLSDPSFGATLSVGGSGAQAPTALQGGCACHAHARSRQWPAAFLFGALALLVAHRRQDRRQTESL